jgi:hypothetical protein
VACDDSSIKASFNIAISRITGAVIAAKCPDEFFRLLEEAKENGAEWANRSRKFTQIS